MTRRSLTTVLLTLILIGAPQAWAGKGAPPPLSYDNTITITPSGVLCADGDTLEATVDGITDAGPDNTYLVLLQPGTYALCGDTLFMKPYVDIAGTNRPTTVIRGYGAPSLGLQPTVAGANNARIYTLTILTRPASLVSSATTNSIGMTNAGTSPTVRDVTILSEDGVGDRGIRNIAASPVLEEVDIVVRGQTRGWGIVNQDASVQLEDVNITVFGASDGNIGILGDVYNGQGVDMERTTVYAGGGAEDIAIRDNGDSLFDPWLVARGCVIRGDHYGVLAVDSHSSTTLAGITLTASHVEGAISTIDAIFSSVLVANSTLAGGPVVASTATCINVVDADGAPYGPACESP